MRQRRFVQCDVFSPVPAQGNGLAVVVDAAGLTDAQMQRFAAWTNLAETSFLLPPTDPAADYRVRIFTPAREMPFAGHPTLGSCAVWRHIGGVPREDGIVRQQCGIGRGLRASGDREYLVIDLVVFDLFQQAEGFAVDGRAGRQFPVGDDEAIDRIAVLAPRADDKAIRKGIGRRHIGAG